MNKSTYQNAANISLATAVSAPLFFVLGLLLLLP